MVTTTYLLFVASFCVLGGLVGIFAHFWRAHATMYAEDLGLGEPYNTLSRDDYQFEKHVVGAEWDDAGFWDPDSIRNLLYYMAMGVGIPLLVGFLLWDQRAEMVGTFCRLLAEAGFNSLLCS